MAGQGGNQNNDDNGIWIVLGMLLVIIMIWFLLKDKIIYLFLFLYQWIFVVAEFFGKFVAPQSTFASDNLMIIKEVLKDTSIIDFQNFMKLLANGGWYLKFLIAPPLIWYGLKIRKNVIKTYCEKMSVTRFLQRQSKIWKPIVPVLHLDLINKPPKEWRDPYTTSEIAKKRKLIFNRYLNDERTKQYLIEQLGKKIEYNKTKNKDKIVLTPILDNLTNYERALFAIFGLRIIRERKGKDLSAQILLDELNESCRGTGIPKWEISEPIFQRLKTNSQIIDVIKAHSYVRTALVEMLCCARKLDGVLPPSNFIWLRPIDPILFYALNRAPIVPERLHTPSFVESAGVLAQWQSERVAFNNNHKLNAPYLEHAIDAIEEDLMVSGLIDPHRIDKK